MGVYATPGKLERSLAVAVAAAVAQGEADAEEAMYVCPMFARSIMLFAMQFSHTSFARASSYCGFGEI